MRKIDHGCEKKGNSRNLKILKNTQMMINQIEIEIYEMILRNLKACDGEL